MPAFNWNKDTPSPPKFEFDHLKFTTICEIEPGLAWVEIENSKQANFAARAGRTPVDIYFDAETTSEFNRGRPAPHRWFMLVAESDGRIKGEVVMAAPGPGQRLRQTSKHVGPLHVVGHGNSNAYPEWAFEIASLSETVNIPMPPNFAGRPLSDSKTARVANLLDRYGSSQFDDKWLSDQDRSQEAETIRDIMLRARMGNLDEDDADYVVGSYASYGDAGFGEAWRPSDAAECMGKADADELISLLDWVDEENAVRQPAGKDI